MKTKTIRLSRIKISNEMKATMPRVDNMNIKYSYYRRFHKFHSPIVVDKKYTLVDGYITYLLASMFQIKKIEIHIV